MSKPINLLLVEDDLAVSEALAKLLSGENYNVLTAANFAEAVAGQREKQSEIVILGVQLGNEDGWFVFHALKELNPSLPIIVASAQPNRLRHDSASSANGVLEKPFAVEHLLVLLVRAMPQSLVKQRSSLAGCVTALLLGLLFPFMAAGASFQITDLKIQNEKAIVTWQGGVTATNQVQFRSSLNAQWQDMDVPTSGSSLTNIITAPSGFYRVISLPDVSASADKRAPSTPTGLTARAASCSQIDLSWIASTDSGQNATGVLGYNIYRNGIFLKQVLAPATSASDVGLMQSTTYTYTVLAVDNSRNASAKSSPASASTGSCGGIVNLPPVANAGADLSLTVGSSGTFTASGSSDPDGSINSYQWDFGDGGVGSGFSVTHTYSSLGVYTVRLTVTDNLGASASDTALVTVVALPDFTAPTAALTSPASGSTISSTITGAASASDNVGGSGVARVEVYNDNG